MRNALITAIALILLPTLRPLPAATQNAGPQNKPAMQMMQNGSMKMPAVDISVADTETGVVLTLTPKDPSQLESFRAMVRQHAEQMKKGECPMMSGMANGMMGSTKDAAPQKPEAKTDADNHKDHHPSPEKN